MTKAERLAELRRERDEYQKAIQALKANPRPMGTVVIASTFAEIMSSEPPQAQITGLEMALAQIETAIKRLG